MTAQGAALSSARAAPTSSDDGDASVVYVVEDDPDLREGLLWILNGAGFRPLGCESGRVALDVVTPDKPSCVLTDFFLPDMNGLELQRRLLGSGRTHPFIVISGRGDVASAVEALQEGAIDFLQKPFSRDRLLECVRLAVARDRKRRRIDRLVSVLTDREREILWLVAEGCPTKAIARKFGISPRTVDVHRHNILKKMEAQSLLQLVRVLIDHGYLGASPGD